MKKPFLTHNIYVDASGLHWAGLAESSKGYRLGYREHLKFTRPADPLSASGASGQMLDWLKSAETKNAAAELVKRLPSKRSGAGLSFSETFCIFRLFAMPMVEKVYRRKAIPIEARKHIPFPLEECLYDWKTVDLKVDGKPVLGVLFAAIRKDILEASVALCSHAGLKVAFVDAPSMAVSRALEMICALKTPSIPFAKENVLALYLDSEQIQLQIFSRAMPLLSRSIYLTDAAVRGSFLLERRKLDLEATMDFVKRQFGIEKPDRLLLYSSAALDKESVNNWASGLSEELGMKTEIMPALPAGVSADGKPIALSGWSEIVSMGTALRGVSQTLDNIELDLSAQLSEEPVQKTALKKIWAVSTAVSIFFLGLGSWKAMDASGLKAKLASTRQTSLGALELKGKTANEIKNLLAARMGEISILHLAAPNSERRFYLTPILEELAKQIPKESWLESWGFKSDVASVSQPGVAPRAALAWRGKIYSMDGQKDFALINAFFKTFKESSVMTSHFPKADISVKKEEDQDKGRSTLAFVMGFNSDGQ